MTDSLKVMDNLKKTARVKRPDGLNSKGIARRRFLTIVAASCVLPVQTCVRAMALGERYKWRGSVMGARAGLDFYGGSKKACLAATRLCLDEVERLEQIFSLLRAGSEISRLNRDGKLHAASHDLRLVLGLAQQISRATKGAFDPTVQSLWQVNEDWFSTRSDTSGPPHDRLQAALRLVDWRKIAWRAGALGLGNGQSITLNGIAQGYITDRIVSLLKGSGWKHVLVDMGEYFAIDKNLQHRPFQLALQGTNKTVSLAEAGLSSSRFDGFVFPASGQHRPTHLFDPQTGETARFWQSVHVRNDRAALADGLSTAFACMRAKDIASTLPAFKGTTVWAVSKSGAIKHFTS